MKDIEFTHSGSSAVFGNFAAGDKARVSDDLAEHFVVEAGCAKYSTNTAPAKPATKTPKKPKAAD